MSLDIVTKAFNTVIPNHIFWRLSGKIGGHETIQNLPWRKNPNLRNFLCSKDPAKRCKSACNQPAKWKTCVYKPERHSFELKQSSWSFKCRQRFRLVSQFYLPITLTQIIFCEIFMTWQSIYPFGIGSASISVTLFSFRKSMQNRTDLSYLGTNTTGKHYGETDGSFTHKSSIS